MFSCFHYKLRV